MYLKSISLLRLLIITLNKLLIKLSSEFIISSLLLIFSASKKIIPKSFPKYYKNDSVSYVEIAYTS